MAPCSVVWIMELALHQCMYTWNSVHMFVSVMNINAATEV